MMSPCSDFKLGFKVIRGKRVEADNIIAPQQAGTLHGLFVERVRRSPDKIAYQHFDQDQWRNISWQQMANEVARWQAALSSLELQCGERVAIMLRNCPWWVMFDQAAMSLGLVVVPLYTQDRPDNVAYILNNADVKVLLLETAVQWKFLRPVCDQLNSVKCFVSINDVADPTEPRLKSMAKLLPDSAILQPGLPCPMEELASIIYTSGTTGKPKGVMLSHANMLSNAHSCLGFFPVYESDSFLSFLPLSHTFERTLGYYLAVMAGAKVTFARSIPQLSEDLQVIRPTLLISVPRIYERIHTAVRNKLAESSPLKQKLFELTINIGWARFLHQQKRGDRKWSFLLWPVLQKLVAQKVLAHLGGQLRAALSGGAALSPEVSRVFVGLGLPMIQGYGLTETSPVICGNKLDNNFPDSVGLPIKDITLKLGTYNTLLVKGPNVMLGYWNNPEATQATIDPDGWLNTGDIVRISETGHLYITGRIKEIIVMSNGEKIPPSDMEIAILKDPLFDQVMIYGEAHPFLVALVVINSQAWENLAREVGVRGDMPEALQDSRVEARVLKQIALRLHGFPGYAKVRRALLFKDQWTMENDLLTPTLKLKRSKVMKHFEAEINQLYTKR